MKIDRYHSRTGQDMPPSSYPLLLTLISSLLTHLIGPFSGDGHGMPLGQGKLMDRQDRDGILSPQDIQRKTGVGRGQRVAWGQGHGAVPVE